MSKPINRPLLRKSCSRIAMLPPEVRLAINQHMRQGLQIKEIQAWLFEQIADQDLPRLGLKKGDPYSHSWTREGKFRKAAPVTCQASLSRWFYTSYREWLDEEASRDESVQLVEHVEQLASAASKKGQPNSREGGNMLIRSLLIDAINSVRGADKDPARIAQLANAWARMSQTATETEKLNLLTQEAIETGLDALYAQAKDNPKALALFKKFHDAVKQSAKPTA